MHQKQLVSVRAAVFFTTCSAQKLWEFRCKLATWFEEYIKMSRNWPTQGVEIFDKALPIFPRCSNKSCNSRNPSFDVKMASGQRNDVTKHVIGLLCCHQLCLHVVVTVASTSIMLTFRTFLLFFLRGTFKFVNWLREFCSLLCYRSVIAQVCCPSKNQSVP